MTVRYYATVAGRRRVVDLERAGEGRYRVSIDGAVHDVDARTTGDGSVSVLYDLHAFDAALEEFDGGFNVLVRGQVLRVEVIDERRERMRAAPAGFAIEGEQRILAPMPGKVARVLVRAGDTVEAGQGLVVVEAMKMENELRAPKAGRVREVLAREGAAVDAGAVLAVVE